MNKLLGYLSLVVAIPMFTAVSLLVVAVVLQAGMPTVLVHIAIGSFAGLLVLTLLGLLMDKTYK